MAGPTENSCAYRPGVRSFVVCATQDDKSAANLVLTSPSISSRARRRFLRDELDRRRARSAVDQGQFQFPGFALTNCVDERCDKVPAARAASGQLKKGFR